MSVGFLRGQQLGREDLNIYTANTSGHPTNAAEITYGVYDFTTGQEVLVGPSKRQPANPAIGEYYASLVIPLDANVGTYRIRWAMRESIGGPLQSVVQEFTVGDRTQLITTHYSEIQADLIRRLRISTRDNCVGGEERVELDVNGERVTLSLEELWECIHERAGSERVRESFEQGTLKTLTISPMGESCWKKVLAVTRADTLNTVILEVTTTEGSSSLTEDHRVYVSPTNKKESKCLEVGDKVLSSEGFVEVLSVKKTPSRKHMYDLTVEGWHNFKLRASGMVVSNCPDRNYNFRPPAHAETIDQFSKVFGYIWEDEELLECLERSLDMIISTPPATPFPSIEHLVQLKKEWTTLLITGAQIWAYNQLQSNWTVDSFSYSIGGISLEIDKASKYESLKQSASDFFEKQLTNAKATVKITRGLQQPKYGMGIRSAFGPNLGSGILSPRKFVGF